MKARKSWADLIQTLREHKCQPRLLYLAKLSIIIDGETKIFHDKTIFAQYLSTNPALQRIIDGKCQHKEGVLAGFVCQHDTGWSYHRERSFSWGSASMSSICGAFSQLVIKGGRTLMGGTISGLVFLGSLREQTEQARGSKPVRIISPWPLHQLLHPTLLFFQS